MLSKQLLDFFDKRAVHGLSTGATVTEVESVLGEADDFALLGRKRKIRILKYGQIEFYFERSICSMIQFTFYGSKIQPVYEKELLQVLRSKKIDYEVLSEFTNEDTIAYITNHQIIIIIDSEEKEAKKIYFADRD